MSDEPGIRASDAEREQTVERLRVAAGEGRLTLEELADRIEAVAGSRTRGELQRTTADLPAAPAPAPGAPTTPATYVPQQLAAPIRSTSLFGDLKRSGPWQLPASSEWSTVFGDVKLDLRQAAVPAGGEIVVDARTVFGDVELLVPEGVLVELRAKVFFGDLRQEAGLSAPPGAPRIVLSGSTVFGDVSVKARRLRERLAARLRAGRGELA